MHALLPYNTCRPILSYDHADNRHYWSKKRDQPPCLDCTCLTGGTVLAGLRCPRRSASGRSGSVHLKNDSQDEVHCRQHKCQYECYPVYTQACKDVAVFPPLHLATTSLAQLCKYLAMNGLWHRKTAGLRSWVSEIEHKVAHDHAVRSRSGIDTAH